MKYKLKRVVIELGDAIELPNNAIILRSELQRLYFGRKGQDQGKEKTVIDYLEPIKEEE